MSSPGPNSAWFSPTTGDIYFGTAPSGILNDFAKEDKVIYHEYSHAVFYDIQSGVSANSGEEGAIREGVPDYLAGAYTGRPIFGDYSNPNYQRDMSNPAIESYSAFDNTFPVQYKAAEFFSSVLWDIRNQTGISNSESDFLVFDALSIISGNPNFLEFRDAMILADEAAYSGSHKTLIYKAFADRGIGKPYSIFSGNINSPTNWTGLVHLNGNVNVYSNLTIEKGTDIWLDSNVSLSIQPSNGKLVAEGTETEPIRFIRGDADNDWNRVSLLSSAGNSIKWTLFDGGYINLSIASKNNVIENSTFRNAAHRTIEGWHNQDGSGNASAIISHSLIENSSSIGIVAQYLDLDLGHTTIQNNNQDGLYVHSSTVFPFYQNLITNNGLVISSRDGARITSSGTFYMLGASYDEGYNEISDNAHNQIENYGDTIVGAALSGSGGYNSVKGNNSGSNYLVANYGSVINSVGTWWGQTSTDPAMFTGSVSGTHLTFDPTSTPGNDGESPAKVIFREDINFNQLFDEAEEALSNATNSDEIQHRFHHLYQLEGLANKSDITDRFQDLTTLATQEINSPFTAQSLKNTYRELAVILHTKSLIRNENYSEAQSYLDEVNYSELSAKNHREYVDLRLVTETYHGKYETALATLDELYSLHQAEGLQLEEVQSRYSPIREDILTRLEGGEGNTLKEKQEVDGSKDTIEEFSLQNYPNPFNPVTVISYSISEKSFVTLTVYDLLGREVTILVNENKGSGSYSVRFDASSLSSGVYIYRLETSQKVLTKRMTVIK